MKRGYLLPEGCKDLIDVIKQKSSPQAPLAPVIKPVQGPAQQPKSPAPFPPILGEIPVPAQMTVAELADALAQKPFVIIKDLIELDVFANLKTQIDFDTISKVVRKHGLAAKLAD